MAGESSRGFAGQARLDRLFVQLIPLKMPIVTPENGLKVRPHQYSWWLRDSLSRPEIDAAIRGSRAVG
jgi:hypothetical protein